MVTCAACETLLCCLLHLPRAQKVFDDADLDLAVDGAMTAKFRNAGQVCIAPNRFMVQEGIYDEFVAKMAKRIRSLQVGDGLDPRTNIGPLINLTAREKVSRSAFWAIITPSGIIVLIVRTVARFCQKWKISRPGLAPVAAIA